MTQVFGDAVGCPQLSVENILALEVWHWMGGGWRPDLMPMAVFLFDFSGRLALDVQDRLMMIARLVRR